MVPVSKKMNVLLQRLWLGVTYGFDAGAAFVVAPVVAAKCSWDGCGFDTGAALLYHRQWAFGTQLLVGLESQTCFKQKHQNFMKPQ